MFAPDREGFCPGLWVQFVEDSSQQEFSSLTTREERLTWIYGRRLVAERMELMMRSGSVKDAQQSQARRETGNQYFLAGDLHTAMVNYSRAVVLAEDGSQNLAAAFAELAACLQRLGWPEFALIPPSPTGSWPGLAWTTSGGRRGSWSSRTTLPGPPRQASTGRMTLIIWSVMKTRQGLELYISEIFSTFSLPGH